MMKTSIKREQSQAGLSFAERKNFRPKVKNKLLLLLALLMTAATGAWGQTVVTIGNGTDTSPFVPYNSSFNNSLEEQIYLASEIGQSGIITAISFNSADDETYNETINVYMKNVTRSSFSSTTDYEPLAASDIVFSGSVTFGKGWKTVTLDTPFEYDNTKNLLICFYKKGSTSYSIYNTYTTQAENRTIAFYHDTNVPDPYNLGSYPKFIKLSATRANIKITIEAGGGGSGSGDQTYSVSMKDGVKDADKWTVKVGEGQAQALPIGGLKGDGSETVTLQYNGRLKVKGVKATSDAAPAAVPVTAITLNKTETSIKVGATETLSVTSVLPEEATDKTYTWKTSDETKATVDQDGKVTAIAAGTVTIYAEANDGSGVKGNCSVTVTPAIITVTWNNDDITGTGMGTSFSKDGVTITAEEIDFREKNLMGGGTFTTSLGNFTKIEVTCEGCEATGTGWSGNFSKKTWAGTPASTVNFSGNFMGMGMGITIVCTIVPTN